METNGSSRRSNLTANRHVQHALVRRVFLHWCIFVVSGIVVSGITKGYQTVGTGTSWGEFLTSFAVETVPFLVVTLAVLPAFLLDSFRISHRFAGPMVRFRRAMAEVVGGRTSAPINFRPGDFWHDIAVHFNRVHDRFNSERGRREPKQSHQHETASANAEELVGSSELE